MLQTAAPQLERSYVVGPDGKEKLDDIRTRWASGSTGVVVFAVGYLSGGSARRAAGSERRGAPPPNKSLPQPLVVCAAVQLWHVPAEALGPHSQYHRGSDGSCHPPAHLPPRRPASPQVSGVPAVVLLRALLKWGARRRGCRWRSPPTHPPPTPHPPTKSSSWWGPPLRPPLLRCCRHVPLLHAAAARRPPCLACTTALP